MSARLRVGLVEAGVDLRTGQQGRNAEAPRPVLARHVAEQADVAGFEHVQRQRAARHQHVPQREQREQLTGHVAQRSPTG